MHDDISSNVATLVQATWASFESMADRRRKLEEIDDLQRKVAHVSQSSLSELIVELKRVGLPELHRRADMQEARDMKLEEDTAYGPKRAGFTNFFTDSNL